MDDIRKLTGIIIDPGHGGTDSGATGNDMLEKDCAIKHQKKLEKYGKWL